MRTKSIGVYGFFPYVSGIGARTDYTDEFLRWLFDPDAALSLRRYWRDVSGGELDVHPEIFGFILAEGQSYIDRLCQSSRPASASEAVKILFELGYDPGPYDGLVFVIAGRIVNGGSTDVTFGGRTRAVNYFDDRKSHTFMAHELGHLLGLHHPFDTSLPSPDYKYGEYADPTCIMSAENFGGNPVTFEIAAGSRAFADAASPFWKSAGPGVSMASLWRYSPDFPAPQPFSMELPPSAPPTPVRLNRAGDTGLRLVTMPTTGVNSWYTVEYRPAVQWDRGLPWASAGVGAKAGVVIHQVRDMIGFVGDGVGWPKFKQVCLAGIIPVPSTGDLDWSDANFAVRVAASNLGWVDLIVGATVPTVRSVSVKAESKSTFVSGAFAESVEVPRTGSNCGTNTYTATRSNMRVDISAEAISAGFDAPRFRYEVNGVTLNMWTGPTDMVSGQATFTVDVRVPTSLTSHVVQKRLTTVSFTASANKISIGVPPGDGTYDLSLVCFVTDNPTPGEVGIASSVVILPVTTASIHLPAEAIADQGKCIARIAHELRQRRRWPPDEEHPDWRVPTFEEAWSTNDLATLGQRVIDAAEFERLYPAIGARAVADLAAHLKLTVPEARSIAESLSRQIEDRQRQ